MNKKATLNYFSKNLKTLRAEHQLSQVEFGRLFGLSKSNINSYERGAFPEAESFIRIMNHFNLDPSKFILLDMERQSVRRETTIQTDGDQVKFDQLVDTGLSDTDQFRYLEDFTNDQLKEIYIKTFKAKEQLIKEVLDIKSKYISLLEEHKKTTN